MLKNIFHKAISDIPTPERKLNVLMPVLGLIVLAAVVIFLYKTNSLILQNQVNDLKKDNKELHEENKILRHEKDSIKNDADLEREETIKKLNSLINQQNEQKELLRK